MSMANLQNSDAGALAAKQIVIDVIGRAFKDIVALGRTLALSVAPVGRRGEGRFAPPAPVKHSRPTALIVPGAAAREFAPLAFLRAMNSVAPDSPLAPVRLARLHPRVDFGGPNGTSGLANILNLAPKNLGAAAWPARAGHAGGNNAGWAPVGRPGGFAAAVESRRHDSTAILQLGAAAMGGGLPSVAPVRRPARDAGGMAAAAMAYQHAPMERAAVTEGPPTPRRAAIDERQLSGALKALLDRQGRLPPSGTTGFDPRLTPAWSGLQLPA